MKPKITKAKANLFQIPLERVIDQEHPLVQLSREFDWEEIRREIAVNFCDSNGKPEADTRVVLGLLYLKGKTADKVNALMSAIGYSFMKLMRAFFLAFFGFSNPWPATSG